MSCPISYVLDVLLSSFRLARSVPYRRRKARRAGIMFEQDPHQREAVPGLLARVCLPGPSGFCFSANALLPPHVAFLPDDTAFPALGWLIHCASLAAAARRDERTRGRPQNDEVEVEEGYQEGQITPASWTSVLHGHCESARGGTLAQCGPDSLAMTCSKTHAFSEPILASVGMKREADSAHAPHDGGQTGLRGAHTWRSCGTSGRHPSSKGTCWS